MGPHDDTDDQPRALDSAFDPVATETGAGGDPTTSGPRAHRRGLTEEPDRPTPLLVAGLVAAVVASAVALIVSLTVVAITRADAASESPVQLTGDVRREDGSFGSILFDGVRDARRESTEWSDDPRASETERTEVGEPGTDDPEPDEDDREPEDREPEDREPEDRDPEDREPDGGDADPDDDQPPPTTEPGEPSPGPDTTTPVVPPGERPGLDEIFGPPSGTAPLPPPPPDPPNPPEGPPVPGTRYDRSATAWRTNVWK